MNIYYIAAAIIGLGVAYATGVLQKAFRFIYGDFTPNELKKFLLYGVLICLIIGVYWELRCVKDAIFSGFVDPRETWKAKWLSLIVVFPLVTIYSYLVDLFPRQKLFYAVATIYAVTFFVIAYLVGNPDWGLYAPKEARWGLLGWTSYVAIESFGTLMVALFYSFMADTTTPESGKKGYFITATLAQVGAIAGSYAVASKCADVNVLLNYGAAVILVIPFFVWFILYVTPKEEFAGYQAKGAHEPKKEKKTGFIEGLKLMLSQPYLLAIFFIISAFEIIVTIFDLQFKILIAEFSGGDANKFAAYSGEFGVYLSVLALVSLLFGIGKIGRKIGITLSLSLMPLLLGVNILVMAAAFFGWLSFVPVITVVFWIQVVSKGINYALGQPSKEQLFIPTSKEAKYKSKAWVDMFGSRFSKASGSGVKGFQAAMEKAGYFTLGASTMFLMGTSFVICLIWFFVAMFAGKKATTAVERNEIVC